MDSEPKNEEKQLAERHRRRLAELAADKKRILAMPPENALDAILEHPMNRALVHSMAEEDLFFLINDIGHYEAIDILSLASNRQWEYILDIEAWHRDRIQLDTVVYWLNLLHQADPNRFLNWTMEEKYDLLEYFLYRKADIHVREHDEDPGDIGDGFFTCDDVFYVRFSSDAFSGIEDEENQEEIESFVYTMMRRIADEDHMAYQLLLLRAASVMPGESEEEAFRLRNVRLAEKGFLPFDEAIGVYSPIKPGAIRKEPRKAGGQKSEMDFTVPVPVNHASLLGNDTLLGNALKRIDSEDVLNEIQVEFASLCNRIIAADQNPVREKEHLKTIVNKAAGFLEIGIHRLAGTAVPPDADTGAHIICNYPMPDIFRTGYALVLDLQRRAKQWRKKSWYSKNALALSFWGEDIVGHIGGLLLKYPKCFDNYKTGLLYREFSSIQDIKAAGQALNEAITFDRMLSLMDIDTRALPDEQFITFYNLLLTLWARNRSGLAARERLEPISLDAFRPFYRSLWERDENRARIKESVKTDFLEWLSGETGFTMVEISEKAAGSLEKMFLSIEDEFSLVGENDLDHRFVNLFLLKK